MISLVLTSGGSATNEGIQKNIFGSSTTVLTISDEEMEDVMKIITSFEESELLIIEQVKIFDATSSLN